MRATRAFGWVLLVIVALVVAAASILFFINASDEPLNPEAYAALDTHFDSIPRQDNAYFAILGLDSRNDADVNAEGQRAYERYLTAFRAHPEAAFSFAGDAAFPRQPIDGLLDGLCGSGAVHEDCVERMREHPDDFAHALSANSIFVERYEGLTRYERFVNPVSLTVVSPIPSWQPFLVAKRLWLTQRARQITGGDTDQAIDAMQREVAFTRRLLAQPNLLLIDKVVLATSLRNSLIFISDLVRATALSDAQYARLAESVAPLSDDERSLAGVFAR